jgi:hypothetical protein
MQIMNSMQVVNLAASELGTGGIQKWLLDNIVPLAILGAAVIMLWIGGGQGSFAGVAKRVIPLLIALAIVGFAVTGEAVDMGKWLAGLFIG